MACPSTDTLSNVTFANTCLTTNVHDNKPVQDAMKTCCGPSKVFEVDNGCISYCNITTVSDLAYWSFCLEDTLDTETYKSTDNTCFVPDEKIESALSNPSATGVIATTWTAEDKNLTVVETIDGVPQTRTDNAAEFYSDWVQLSLLPNNTATSGSHTSQSTAGVSTTEAAPKSTGTSSAPSATKAPSMAIKGTPVSKVKIAALAGFFLFGLLA